MQKITREWLRPGCRAAAWLLSILVISAAGMPGNASAAGDIWSVSLSPSVVFILSGSAGSGKDAPRYGDAFETGYGIALEVERAVSPRAGLHGGVGYERHDGKDYQGLSFGDLEIVPVYVGGWYRFPVSPAVGLYLKTDLGAAHLSSVDISSGSLDGRYWKASWAFLFNAGAGLEYHGRGPWSAALQMDFRYLGEPDSALGAPSDAGPSWTMPLRFALKYSF